MGGRADGRILRGDSVMPVPEDGGAGPPPGPEASALLWLTANQGITGTGAQVDTWDTRSDSGLSATEAGTGKPVVVGDFVDMDNSASRINHFEVGNNTTFEATTNSGEFIWAWRGTIDAYDAPAFSVIDLSLIHTRGGLGRGVNLFVFGSQGSLSWTTWDNTSAVATQIIWAGWGAYYTLGDPVDIVVKGDGVNHELYVDGVLRGSAAHVSAPGAHVVTPLLGRLFNTPAGAYHIGRIQGLFFDDANTYTVAEATALVTLP